MMIPKPCRIGAVLLLALAGCTQETQNQISRSIQNWTGTNGVLEIYAGDKLVRRFIGIDKLTTASGTDDGGARAYRYGYGVLDENQNLVQATPTRRRSISRSATTQPTTCSSRTRAEPPTMNQHALVIGGTRGIGLALVEALLGRSGLPACVIAAGRSIDGHPVELDRAGRPPRRSLRTAVARSCR